MLRGRSPAVYGWVRNCGVTKAVKHSPQMPSLAIFIPLYLGGIIFRAISQGNKFPGSAYISKAGISPR
jgi:hypothetical protein